MSFVINSIDALSAHEMIGNDEAILIDVREQHEYDEAHIREAHLIPLGVLTSASLPKNACNKKIIVHCQFGKRGSLAVLKLLSENPSLMIFNLEGGLMAWEEVRLPIVRAQCY